MKPLEHRIVSPPPIADKARAESFLAELRDKATGAGDDTGRALIALLDKPEVAMLLEATFAASPHLTALALRAPGRLAGILKVAPEAYLTARTRALFEQFGFAPSGLGPTALECENEARSAASGREDAEAHRRESEGHRERTPGSEGSDNKGPDNESTPTPPLSRSEGMARRVAIARNEAMAALRRYKADVALCAALADIAGAWGVAELTEAMTRAADAVLEVAVRFLLGEAASTGVFMPRDPSAPERESGYVVLAMGKLGARELNYSSDIDLIVLFDPRKLALAPGQEPQRFAVEITRRLVRLLQDQTGDGYVFRTDLRLRPDPGSTQLAISAEAALQYYESFGQNWERAALIKARPVAGDRVLGQAFLERLAPFIWRKYLDYAALADIHAMKRQVNAHKGFGEIRIAGHDIKVGRGGIREIEFFAQTQQLIAGGRQPDLRNPTTLGALARLAERGWITPEALSELRAAYLFLRHVEHRLQMIADEQTQRLPEAREKLALVAAFCGFATLEAFGATLRQHLERVQRHYGALFESGPEVASLPGSLVFAGDGDDDPETLETLAAMGYGRPKVVAATVRGWHYGRYPATRSERARERLTRLTPALLEALARTADPDRALAAFDRFLAELPGGLQLFALLAANPNLLRLLADIMGSAPRLARLLSRRRRTIEALLDPGFFGTLPTSAELARIVDEAIGAAVGTASGRAREGGAGGEPTEGREEGGGNYEELLDRARVVGNEQAFLIGVRVLSGTIDARAAGRAYAALASHLIAALQGAVEREMARAHGVIAGGAMAVLAMGKLGGCEMTAASDLDLITVYDFADDAAQSDGPRPLAGGAYYARTTQRLISALSSPTAEGRLYEVDMRLRPSGNAGPVATRLSSFARYQREEAWTWEHMALTRARVITGPPPLREAIAQTIRHVLTQPRDGPRLADDVREMRARIAAEKGSDNIWNLKQVRGGLVDLEFIAQFLQLRHAHAHPEVLSQNTRTAFERLTAAGVLDADKGRRLIDAVTLVQNLEQVLRLCVEGEFRSAEAPDGLKQLLARAGSCSDFAELEASLGEMLAQVSRLFEELVVA